MTTVTISNLESEISSFPITQSILLTASSSVEEAQLEETIVLFRLQGDNQLVSLSEPYAYTLGYIKETFDIVPMRFSVSQNTDLTYTVKCTPIQPLNLNSKYAVYVSKELSNDFMSTTKTINKSTADLKISVKHSGYSIGTYTVDCISSPFITNESNISKFRITTPNIQKEYILDLNKKNTIVLEGLLFTFDNVAWADGEQFTTVITAQTELQEDLICVFNTSLTSDIKPIDPTLLSSQISNSDILAFYNNRSTIIAQPQVIKQNANYLTLNMFSIPIPSTISKDDIDLDSFSISIREAFNNYLLKTFGLYDQTTMFKMFIYWDDFDGNYIILELIYSDDESQTDKIVLDTTKW